MTISDHMRRLREKIGNDRIAVPSVTALLFDAEGRMLLARHEQGNWVTPGGAVEPLEHPAEALVREVREETGMRVEPIRIAGVYGGPELEVVYRNGDRVAYLMTVFECRIVEGAPEPDGEEILELRYVTRDELLALELAAWARVILPTLFEGGERARFHAPD